MEDSLADKLNESEKGLFSRMQNATNRMIQLVEDLLTYSHLSVTPLEKEEVDMALKVQLVLADLEVPIEEKRAVFTIHPLPVVKGYKRQLQQLFQNLVSNALKYSHPDVPPHITIIAGTIRGADVPITLPANLLDKEFYLIG